MDLAWQLVLSRPASWEAAELWQPVKRIMNESMNLWTVAEHGDTRAGRPVSHPPISGQDKVTWSVNLLVLRAPPLAPGAFMLLSKLPTGIRSQLE